MKGTARARVTGTVVAVVVTAAVVAGIYLVGSPADERARRLDERRVQDLSGIGRAIDLYWTRQSGLPTSLDQLRPETGVNVTAADPVTSAPYEYRPLDRGKFELCASFDGESQDAQRGLDEGFWTYRAGRQCFQRDARALY